MPRLPSMPSGPDHTSGWASYGWGYFQLFKISLAVAVVGAAIRIAIIKILRNRRRSPEIVRVEEKDIVSAKVPCEKYLRREHFQDTKDRSQEIRPIYPWTSPPQPLPGPYDPRLYPLPTIRRHSYDPSVTEPDQDSSISYTRRVSTNDIPIHQTTLHGSVTTSKRGWRRNQWVISGA